MTTPSPNALSPLGVLPSTGPNCVHLPLQVTPQELARYVVGLANAKGGTVFIGAELVGTDTTPPPSSDTSELHPLMVTHAIFELSGGRLTVNVQQHKIAGGAKILSVYVPQAPYILADPDGAVIAWDGANLVPVTPAESEPVANQDFTAVTPPDSSLADLDPAEVSRLRLLGRRLDAANLPDLDFLRELGLIKPSAGALRPTVAGILLCGTQAALRAHVPQAEVCYYHHQNNDVEFEFREDLLKPIPALLNRIAELIQARNHFTPVQVGLFRIEVWEQDEAVYREALLNALIHRDYTLRDVVHVHHFPDRLEIMNPGGLTGGITPGNILRHQPKRRNPLLAEVLARLGLVEQAGVGVDKMFSLMLRHGKEPPEFLAYPDAVTVTLHSLGFNADFVRFIAQKQEEMQTLSLDMLIVLSVLVREGEVTRAKLSRALQLPEDRTPRLLRNMEEYQLVKRAGVGRGIAYTLPNDIQAVLKYSGPLPLKDISKQPPIQVPQKPKKPRKPRKKTLSPDTNNGPSQAEIRAIALTLARERGQVTNAALREACGLNTQQAWKVLRQLVLENLLNKSGTGTRNTKYHLVTNPN